MQTRGPFVVAAAVALALTACSGSATGRPGTTPSTSTDRVPVTPRATAPAAIAAVARMTEQLDGARTGTFRQKATTRGDSFTLDQVTETSFDLGRQAWTGRTHFEANPPSAFDTDFSQADMRVVVADGTAYMTMLSWPTTLRGRWLAVDPGAGPAAGPQGLSGEPFAVLALRGFTGMSVVPSSDGTSTIKGHIDLGSAVGLLGVRPGVVKAGIDPSTLKGRAYATVVTDAQGLPTTLTVDGHDIFGATQLPEKLSTLLPRQIVEVRFEHLGSPVDVAVPASSTLIDPAEMDAGDPTGATPST